MSGLAPIYTQSIERGETRAKALIARQSVSFGPPAGYLIAEGDSWFDYPFFQDILEALRKHHNYRVRSAAHHGDTAESMAYEDNQLDKLRQLFQDLAEENDAQGSRTPKAVLLSCGGNDVAQTFGVLLNHQESGLPTINDDIARGLLEIRVMSAICSLIASVITFSEEYFQRKIPVLIHGYGRPVPDGRGFPILSLSGPWLKPGFVAKGYVSADPQSDAELQRNAFTTAALIDRFNDSVLAKIPQLPPFVGVVTYVDLRTVFSNVVAGASYQNDWRDEMHATARASTAAARLIASHI